MLEIRPFLPEHVLEIPAREPDKGIMQSVPNYMDIAREYALHGPCWTGYIGDTPIFCAGLVILWPGVCEGWAYTSDLVRALPHEFHRAVRRGLAVAAREYKLRRIQFSIPEDHAVSRKWAISLGFAEESVMPMYGPRGETYCRYVRLGSDQWPS